MLVDSLLPVFMIIITGFVLKRISLLGDEGWSGLERISYFVFLPLLLFRTIANTDFTALATTGLAAGFLCATLLLLASMFAVRPLLQGALGVSAPAYSSIYQGVTRWNAFVTLAIAERMDVASALSVVAIGIGVMIVPINLVNILAMAAWGERGEKARPSFWRLVVTNPLIVGVVAGMIWNASGLVMPGPIDTSIDILSRVSLPLGLLLVGAALRVRMPGREIAAVVVASLLKLFVQPLFLTVAAWLFGVRGGELMIVALCGAGPSAMNGYVVARQLGGDAPLFAAIVTLQTALSFLTIPIIMAAVTYASG
ncbi:MAG: AEC family transporter [Rhizobiaceae bacterium]